MGLWSEIRQRRITQIVFTYLAGGWMVLAVFDQVVDREVLPLVVYEVALTLYLVGIAAALIIGWYHGEKGAQKAPPIEIAILVLVGLVGLGASARVIRASLAEAGLEAAIDADDLRRIAVLYLDDMSRDGSMRPVADGITEGLITSLASVRELDVRSRNASREARGLGDVPVDSIAEVLEVGALIDGTVDQVGDELRVSVRLLEGTTGTPLFRETFDWPAEDVASVGASLANEVASALRSRLGVEIRLREGEASAPNTASWLQVARAERFIQEADAALAAGDPEAYAQALGSAEAELAAAQESAPEWPEPLMLRSQVAHQQYVLAGSLEELVDAMDLAVEHADAALRLDPNHAAALEWRGTAAYRKWLNLRNRQTDREELDDLLAQAQADLERAETIDPDRASANSTLSHLYYQVDDLVGAALAARTAYEQDAFLLLADEVLWRLFTTAYDLAEAPNAETWCEEGRSRFPEDFRFTQCQLLVMTMPGVTPDVDRAWELHAQLIPLVTEQPEVIDAQARATIGAIIGMSGMPDSADVVFSGARLGPDEDPVREHLAFEAGMRALVGDADEAVELLERYLLANPDEEVTEYWWWRGLAGNPDFERLRAR